MCLRVFSVGEVLKFTERLGELCACPSKLNGPPHVTYSPSLLLGINVGLEEP
jgi:hypothetical protein